MACKVVMDKTIIHLIGKKSAQISKEVCSKMVLIEVLNMKLC